MILSIQVGLCRKTWVWLCFFCADVLIGMFECVVIIKPLDKDVKLGRLIELEKSFVDSKNPILALPDKEPIS